MDDKMRQGPEEAYYPAPAQQETIQVEQVLGAEMAQKVVDFDMTVPAQDPDIEQIIDVYVKNVQVTDITVLTDKVIVRGTMAVKIMYVADQPGQPVHAFDRGNIRFVRDIDVEGAQPGMKATADVSVEFLDYEFAANDPRTVRINVVLKFWTRVTSTTDMDVYTFAPPGAEMPGQVPPAGPEGAMMPSGPEMYPPPAPEQPVVTGPIAPSAGAKAAAGGQLTVTGSVVNIRTGPGTNYPVVTKVNQGTVLTVKDQAFGWYKVVLPDGSTTGWIASWLVSGAGAPDDN